jgi:predicted amidohydrolase
VRVFAVGNKVRVADGASYQSYRDKMSALMDRSYPNRSSFVQAGVDDVASHLRAADPSAPARALVVFPEDVGLVPILIGSRGAIARSQNNTTGAFLQLFGPYAPVVAPYAEKYPGQPFVRYLFLGLTDTLYRSFYETFRELAKKYGVYLAATMNAAPARRVDAADDPALVARLRDPDEPQRTYAYEATSPHVTNATYVFAPDGEVIVPDGKGGTLESPSQTGGVIRPSSEKAYLTQPEQPPPGEALGLGLGFGSVDDLDVLDTPVGKLGIVISKDAWMMDVNDRFAAKGANLILQPEAFSDWGFPLDPWAPDNFKEGGFANLQKRPELRYNVDASMTGSFFEQQFDGQSAIIGRKDKTGPGALGPGNAWIGENPDTGFIRIAPWIEPDPGIADPSLTLAQRRSALALDGLKLRTVPPCPDPLQVGLCKPGHRESIVWADLSIPRGPTVGPRDATRARPPAFDSSVLVSGREHLPPGQLKKLARGSRVKEKFLPAEQRDPDVAAAGSRVYAVWDESRGAGLRNVWLAVSEDRGRSFGNPVHVSANPAGTVEELDPTVAAAGDQVAVTWQEFATPHDDDRGRIELARFDLHGRKQGADVRVDDTDAGGKWLPAVALVAGKPIVTWIDERDQGPDGATFEHVYAARATDGGGFGANVRVDAGVPVPQSFFLDNKWSPTIATAPDGRVYVAWADFRNYNWDIFLARSEDGGQTFGSNVRVDDYPVFERLNERPTLAVGANGVVHAAWTDLRAVEPDTNIFYAHSDLGASFSVNRQLDDSRAGFDPNSDTPSNQWHPSMAASGGNVFVAWQDNRLGNNDVFFTSSRDGGGAFAASERVDDTGVGQSEQTRPALAWADGACYVVWEDNRNGTSDIYLGRRACPDG